MDESHRGSDFANTMEDSAEYTENDPLIRTEENQLSIRTPPNLPIVRVLALFFGISAQAGISGLFNELPLLVNTAPEGAKLPSYFVITIQLANVTAVVYLITKKIFRRTGEFLWIFSLLCSALVAMILLAFYYNVTIKVGDSRYSLVFFALVFVVASLKCSSQVIMIPFMRHFHKKDMVSFFIGQGAGCSLLGLISLFQGNSAEKCTEEGPVVVSNVNFSVKNFLFFIASLHIVSLISFLMLQYYRTIWKNVNVETRAESGEESNSLENSIEGIDDNLRTLISTREKVAYYVLLTAMPFVGLGFLDSISPFATLPYGNSTYRMTLVLQPWTGTITCIMTLWIIPLHRWLIKYIVIALLLSYIYIVCLALIHPNVPFKNSFMGSFAIVTAYVILAASSTYTKLVIITSFRAQEDSQALVHAGACDQFGEASGGIVGFILTNFTSLFYNNFGC